MLFLAPDRRRLEDLNKAVRAWMAWGSIFDDREKLQLIPFQRDQAKGKTGEAERTVDTLIRETWVWALSPHQPQPNRPAIEWESARLSGDGPLAERAGRKFIADGVLLDQLGPKGLRMKMDEHALWRGADHVLLKQVANDFATYLYLPRLKTRGLLVSAIHASISGLFCEHFAYAEAYDAASGRYQGLHATGGGSAPILFDDATVIVKAEAANTQLDRERLQPPPATGQREETRSSQGGQITDAGETPKPQIVRRFFGSVELAPERVAARSAQFRRTSCSTSWTSTARAFRSRWRWRWMRRVASAKTCAGSCRRTAGH